MHYDIGIIIKIFKKAINSKNKFFIIFDGSIYP